MIKQPRVLIVEDDEWTGQGYRRSLEQSGFVAQLVGNGLAAIDAIDHARPDVLILDLFLPGPNGLALIHEIRSHHDIAAIPVVLVTNMAEDLNENDLASYGVVRLLDKVTMKPADIVAAVRGALA